MFVLFASSLVNTWMSLQSNNGDRTKPTTELLGDTISHARNFSFFYPLRWPIYVFNSVVNTKFPAIHTYIYIYIYTTLFYTSSSCAHGIMAIAKAMKALKLHNPMIQFLANISWLEYQAFPRKGEWGRARAGGLQEEGFPFFLSLSSHSPQKAPYSGYKSVSRRFPWWPFWDFKF